MIANFVTHREIIMEHRIINPDKDFAPESQAKKPEHQLPYKDEENDKSSIYRQVCTFSGPFMPMIDLSLSVDELKKMLKQWLEKRKKPIIYNNKTNGTI